MTKRKSVAIAGLLVAVMALTTLSCLGGCGGRSEQVAVTPGPTLTPTPKPCPDIYESETRDDNQNGAKVLPVGTIQDRSFHEPGDVDYIKVHLYPGFHYTFYTQGFGDAFRVNTRICLEAASEYSSVICNEDDLINPERAPASRLDFEPEVAGVYYLRIENVYGTGGCDSCYEYDIGVTAEIAVPTPPAVPDYTSSEAAGAIPDIILFVAWIDGDKVTVVHDDQGEIYAQWTLDELEAQLRENNVLAEDETMEAVKFESSYVGLKILAADGTHLGWIRVGSLEVAPGLICRITTSYKSQPNCQCLSEVEGLENCWLVNLDFPWEPVIQPESE